MQKLLTVFSRWLILQNTPYYVFHKVINVPLIKLNKNSLCCHLFHKKLGLQSLKIFCIFKFIFIFTLSKITNSIHVGLISNWFTHAFEYVWHLLVQIHHNNSRTTLCNFVLTKTRNNLKPAETSWSHPETTWNHMKPPESSHITVLFT